jgi:molybdenum cofactor cytidylyltransferase
VVNREWQEGIASSIRCGIQELNRLNFAAEGAVVLVCDQPYVTPAIINRLIAVHLKTAKPLVSCMYADTVGTPTFFHNSMFPKLLQLEGDGGAKGLLLK